MQGLLKRFRSLSLFGLLALLLTACGQSNPLVGTWRSDQGQTWTFTSDTVTSSVPQLAGRTVKVTYTTSPGTIQVLPVGSNQSMAFHIEDSGVVSYVDPVMGTVRLHKTG